MQSKKEKSRSNSPNFSENKTTEKLYDVIQKVTRKAIVKEQPVKQEVKVKETMESEIYYMDSTRTDPLLTEKQQLVTMIYNNFQEFNSYIGTMPTFYRTGKIIGEGSRSRVIRAQHKLTSHFVAIKCIKKDVFDSTKERLKTEMNILTSLQHANVVMLYDSFESQNHMCFVMEMCGGGDLLSFMNRRKRIDEATAVYLFKQVVQAVEYCH